jgi:hypothetical protein
MTSKTRVVRDAEWVGREYGREKWPAILARIDLELAAGESHIARVVNRVKRWQLATPEDATLEVVVAGRAMRLPGPFALHGGMGLMLEKLLVLAEGADAIIELGSGWGFNLFHLWLNGGPRMARYFACEYTEAGRLCTERLAAIAPTFAIEALPFDYHQPDLRRVGRFAGRVLVFSCHSIEQIPQLSANLFAELRQVARRVDGVHLEPIGWQMAGERGVGSSQEYAQKHDYNRNLWPLLNQLQASGLLRLGECRPEYFGQNSGNSGSMLCWSMDA